MRRALKFLALAECRSRLVGCALNAGSAVCVLLLLLSGRHLLGDIGELVLLDVVRCDRLLFAGQKCAERLK